MNIEKCMNCRWYLLCDWDCDGFEQVKIDKNGNRKFIDLTND